MEIYRIFEIMRLQYLSDCQTKLLKQGQDDNAARIEKLESLVQALSVRVAEYDLRRPVQSAPPATSAAPFEGFSLPVQPYPYACSVSVA